MRFALLAPLALVAGLCSSLTHAAVTVSNASTGSWTLKFGPVSEWDPLANDVPRATGTVHLGAGQNFNFSLIGTPLESVLVTVRDTQGHEDCHLVVRKTGEATEAVEIRVDFGEEENVPQVVSQAGNVIAISQPAYQSDYNNSPTRNRPAAPVPMVDVSAGLEENLDNLHL